MSEAKQILELYWAAKAYADAEESDPDLIGVIQRCLDAGMTPHDIEIDSIHTIGTWRGPGAKRARLVAIHMARGE